MGLAEVPLWVEYVSKLGPVISGLSLLIAAITLHANHDWNRRNFTAQLISNWNKNTKPIIDDIEKIIPGILDFHGLNLKQLSDTEASDIYESRHSNDPDNWKLRTNFIHLLNEFELIAASYKHAVGDRKMIEESFKDIFVKWGHVLEHFIHIYQVNRKNQLPWGSFHEVNNRWKDEDPGRLRPRTDQLFKI